MDPFLITYCHLTYSGRGSDIGDGRVPFRREASVPRASANWSDSLPRKDLFVSNTGSLPRRDKVGNVFLSIIDTKVRIPIILYIKCIYVILHRPLQAGLGRPEPPKTAPKPSDQNTTPQAKPEPEKTLVRNPGIGDDQPIIYFLFQ